ncbi:MAG: o-succinylbenzoate synthase [Flavobacteriales bacterium Tduv]
MKKYCFYFKRPSETSRGVMLDKESYFILLKQDGCSGLGECSLLRGLSPDDVPEYEEKLLWLCQNINEEREMLYQSLRNYPSIYFGLEQAFLSFERDSLVLFPSSFTEGNVGIRINGLIWMGAVDFMHKQLRQKISQGFSCIKLKIGAISFEEEYRLLKKFRKECPTVELCVDANGAFSFEEAPEKLDKLATLGIHSIEQPIRAGQWEAMAELCRKSSLPIALDEDLIGISDLKEKQNLLDVVAPKYLILKPSLCGGFQGSKDWIEEAEKRSIGWWITSALESNVGLSAIAQWVYSLGNPLPQGLGTGELYKNNFPLHLTVKGEMLWYDPTQIWDRECCIGEIG